MSNIFDFIFLSEKLVSFLEYTCMDMDSESCFAEYDFRTKEEPNLIVKSNHPDNVTELVIESFDLPVLTGNFCKIFPNLDEFRSYNCSVEVLDAESFVHCSKLTKLWLMNEKITDLNARIFHHLKNLEVLQLGKQKVNSIHPEAFVGLGNLEVLSLSATE